MVVVVLVVAVVVVVVVVVVEVGRDGKTLSSHDHLEAEVGASSAGYIGEKAQAQDPAPRSAAMQSPMEP